MPFVDYTEAVDAFIIGVFQFAKEHSELGLDDYRTILAEHHIKARREVAGGSGGVRAGRVLCAGAAGERSASGAALRWGTAVPASERVRSALAGMAGGDRDPLTCSG